MTDKSATPSTEMIELTPEEREALTGCTSKSASEAQVREYIALMTKIRKRQYAEKVEKMTKDAAVIQPTVQEQIWRKNGEDLAGQLWAEIITIATKASVAELVPANYMLNAIVQGATEAIIMAIESYGQSYKTQTGKDFNTAKMVEETANNIATAMLHCGRVRGLI